MVYSEESVRQAVQRTLGRMDSAARASEARRSPSGDYEVMLEVDGRSVSCALPKDLVSDYLDSEEQLGSGEWARVIRRGVAALEESRGGQSGASPAALKAAAAACLMGVDLETAARKQGIAPEALKEYLRSQRG